MIRPSELMDTFNARTASLRQAGSSLIYVGVPSHLPAGEDIQQRTGDKTEEQLSLMTRTS